MNRTAREWQRDDAQGRTRFSFDAMGSPCEVLIRTSSKQIGIDVANLATTEAWRIEDKFSRYLPDNVVARINQSAGNPVEVDDETANLLDFAEHLYHLSERRFDITSGSLRRVWTFDGGANLPSAAAVEKVLADVGWHQTAWQRPTLIIKNGMQIDFGGIGKEYAVDKVANAVREHTSEPCLLNFGGDLVATGDPLEPSGWQVGIESITDSGAKADRLIHLKTGALATSGDARRYRIKDGVRYGHILDPLTGWPVVGAPRSVTVAADTCTEAGMLATLAMLKGVQAEAFLSDSRVQFWCLR